MSEPVQFVRNYDDLSTDRGFQFKFYCDHCGNGYLSAYQASTMGLVAGALSTANSLFGGVFGRAHETAYQIQQAVGGKAHDDALRAAVTELKAKFRQCSRCGKWVCPEICWNEKRSLCEGCAPDLAEEAASVQAHVAIEQVREKARAVDQTSAIDVSVDAVANCGSCGARLGTAKFCPECGTPVARTSACASCKAEIPAAAKFCPECGTPRG